MDSNHNTFIGQKRKLKYFCHRKQSKIQPSQEMTIPLNLASVASSMEGPTFSKAASKSAESSLSLSAKMALRAASRNC